MQVPDYDCDYRSSQCQEVSSGSSYVLAMRIKRPWAHWTLDTPYHIALTWQKILLNSLHNQVH